MIYDYIIRLMGAGIAALIAFLPPSLRYNAEVLLVEAQLTAPLTVETLELVQREFVFGLEYYVSVIVDDRRTYRQTVQKRLSFDDGWRIDGTAVDEAELQQKMGEVQAQFDIPDLQPGDRIDLFIKATILPDATFKQSTGLSTRILWDYYVPRFERTYIYQDGGFLPR